MKKRLFILLLCSIGLIVFCTGCGKDKKEIQVKEKVENTTEETAEKTTEEVKNAVIYIGKKGDYGKYNLPYTGKLTPKKVLNGISATTGWNLTLDKKITKKKDGYILCFSKKSAFYTGQTLDKNDEFYIPTEEDFYVTVLDSITKSFNKYFQEDGKTLNMYYWGADDSDLSLYGTGKTIPKDVAYEHKLLETFAKRRYIGGTSAEKYDLEVTFVRMQGDESVILKIDDTTQVYSVTYTALKAIFKNAQEGRAMKIQVTEDTQTGEKLITKIY